MSFSPDWLARREPVDHRSRNRDLLARLAKTLAGRDGLAVVDLGCGAGSNLRALAPILPARQDWRLVDYDPALLAAARLRLQDWAEEAREAAEGLVLRAGSRTLSVSFARADLARNLDSALGPEPGLVTAAAFFDLVSTDFIERLAEAVARRGAVFYTALTYDGVETWEPAHEADPAILAAFHAHQRGDKGFGPAAGPEATAALTEAFSRRGYRVSTAPSPWILGSRDEMLLRELATGSAGAVRETGAVPEDVVEGWLAARRRAAGCTIGHLDCLAVPA